MIVDSSAILAIVFAEPGFDAVHEVLARSEGAGIGAPTAAEASIVLSAQLGAKAPGLLDRFLQEFRIEIVPFAEPHARAALEAFERYGKGRHGASLNFGDCMAYAMAKVAAVPLLYIGDDFSQTDVESALPRGKSGRP